MYVTNISVKNVRQFTHGEFNFQPGFNLLIGENGTGKTTILQCLLASLGSPRQTGKRRGLSDQDIRVGSQMLRVKTRVREEHNSERHLSYSKSFGRRSNRRGNGSDLTVLYYGSKETSTDALKSRNVPDLRNQVSQSVLSGEAFLYQGEHGLVGDGRPEDRFGRSEEIRSFVKEMLARVSPQFKSFHWRFEPYQCSLSVNSDKRRKEISGGKDLERAILRYFLEHPENLGGIDQRRVTLQSNGRILGDSDSRTVIPPFYEILERFKVSGDLGVLSESTAEIRLTPRIVIETPAGDLLLSQLSDGQQRLFSLFVDIARVLSLYAQGRIEDTPAVVLIDEIDVHLHPRWQRIVVPTLEDLFPRCQFIATTHSPFVIQAIDLCKVKCIGDNKLLNFENESISIEDIVEDIQGIDMPQRGRRYETMSHAAERYFRLLRQEEADETDLKSAEYEYRLASEPFTTNPAINAFLRVQQSEWRVRNK